MMMMIGFRLGRHAVVPQPRGAPRAPLRHVRRPLGRRVHHGGALQTEATVRGEV